ncbi:MAG: tetratricopeptide repeat protein [Myxococcales bacterium]|nr:tetratricopeptide repeat protein [Myxococcales bacterium]
MRRASKWLLLLLLSLPAAARADVEGKLNLYESEARQIAETLPRPNEQTNTQQQRKLVDAQLAFSLGDYDQAALTLFELASKPGTEQEAALYYLGESLFQKGDKGAAHTYFAQAVALNNYAGKLYQPSLIRLVEIAIDQGDATEAETSIAALDRVAPGARLPQIPYVKGKFAYSQGKLDEALQFFVDVPKGSAFELQALYYTGTAQVAKKDLAKATEIFTDLTTRRPKTSNDRRVIELSQLALGRLFYERDQPSKAIDSYLLVDRHSDLFPDALYEVAWVYVKAKQFDKALRALELLALSDPTSEKTPTVRILEGNLRIRKAQLVRSSQVTGAVDASDEDPAVEYDKAAAVFRETHDGYYPSYQALTRMLDNQSADSADYLAQLAGRAANVFQAAPPIPEAAAQYLREEPEVQRAVANQVDLATIQAHLNEAEATIARLEGVLSANDKTVVYPALGARRTRIGQIQGELIAIRNDLADQQLALISSSGELAQLTSTRKQLASQFAAMASPEDTYLALVDDARLKFDALDDKANEVSATLDSTQAVAVALRKYVNDPPGEGQAPVPPEQKSQVSTELVATAGEAYAIENELTEIRRELTLGRDLAGVGDESIARSRVARRSLKAAQDGEHRLLAGFAAASRDTGKSKKLVSLGDRAARIAEQLDQTEKQIDAIVDTAMAAAKTTIAAERTNVDAYKTELAEYEIESRAVGGTVLGASFKNVKAKFYDVIVRTDVGAIDVLWSQKEDADDDLKRLNLSRSRELKQLKDEFKDILDQATPNAPAAPKAAEPPPIPAAGAPSGSPDKGAGGARVSPGAEVPKAPVAPMVRPDNDTKPVPAPAPQKGGSK